MNASKTFGFSGLPIYMLYILLLNWSLPKIFTPQEIAFDINSTTSFFASG